MGKPEGKRTLGRPRRKWVDNIKVDLGETGWKVTGCISLDQDRDKLIAFVNAVMDLRVPQSGGTFFG
jgi:hypothetical protein